MLDRSVSSVSAALRAQGRFGRGLLFVRALSCVVALLGSAEAGASGTALWVGSASAAWSNGANWTAQSGTPALPPGAADTALFSGNPTQTCTLDSAQTVGLVTLASGFTGANASLTLAAALSTGGFSMSAGSLVFNGHRIAVTGTAGGGTADLSVAGGTVTASSGSGFVMSGSTGTQIVQSAVDIGSLSISYNSQVLGLLKTGTLTVANGDSLNVNGGNLSITGSGTPVNLNTTGAITDVAGTGTLLYTATATTAVQGTGVAIGNLSVGSTTGAGATFNQVGNLTLTGRLTLNQSASGQVTYAAGASTLAAQQGIDARSGILTSTSSITCAGLLAGGPGSFSGTGSLVLTGGSWSSTTGTANFGSVAIAGAGFVTAASNIVVTSLTITNGATLAMNGGSAWTLTLEGGPGAVLSTLGSGTFISGGANPDVMFAGSGGNVTWSEASGSDFGNVLVSGGKVTATSLVVVDSLVVGNSATFQTSKVLDVTSNLLVNPTGTFATTSATAGLTFSGSGFGNWVDQTPSGQDYGVVSVNSSVALAGTALGVTALSMTIFGRLDLAGRQLTLVENGAQPLTLVAGGTLADSVGTATLEYAPLLSGAPGGIL